MRRVGGGIVEDVTEKSKGNAGEEKTREGADLFELWLPISPPSNHEFC